MHSQADGKCEMIFLTKDGVLHVVDGATGKEKANAKPPVPKGAERWELAMVASFQGKGDQDILLQATNKDGYRTGRYLAAYTFEALQDGGMPLWTTDSFVSCVHNGARLADLDGDGLDEVLGVTIEQRLGVLVRGVRSLPDPLRIVGTRGFWRPITKTETDAKGKKIPIFSSVPIMAGLCVIAGFVGTAIIMSHVGIVNAIVLGVTTTIVTLLVIFCITRPFAVAFPQGVVTVGDCNLATGLRRSRQTANDG